MLDWLLDLYDCRAPGVVCGTDGVTYTSHSDLVVRSCLRNKVVALNYVGPCKGLTSPLILPLSCQPKRLNNARFKYFMKFTAFLAFAIG